MNTSFSKTDLLNLSCDRLENFLAQKKIRPFRAAQILRWIHQRQTDDFGAMTDLAKDLRAMLEDHFVIPRLEIVDKQRSSDGSVKYLFRLADAQTVESVLMPEKGHFTLCVSSQVGCAQGCAFCMTGLCGFVRNLTCGEIVSQVRDISTDLEKNRPENHPETNRLTNLVFMGMGEPLANYPNLLGALNILTNGDWGMKFSSRRVTVSTAGLVPVMDRLGADTAVNLAVSLNAAHDDLRTRLMPINKTYPIRTLIDACRRFHLKPRQRITFEYILLKGINDTEKDALDLVRLLTPVKCKINLIPYNPYPESPFSRPADRQVERFQDILLNKGFTAMVRQSKGKDIAAACGQLRAGLKPAD